ncbi:MAG: hypothetical protein AAGA92_15535 [Planctomycetota bacterium]
MSLTTTIITAGVCGGGTVFALAAIAAKLFLTTAKRVDSERPH